MAAEVCTVAAAIASASVGDVPVGYSTFHVVFYLTKHVYVEYHGYIITSYHPINKYGALECIYCTRYQTSRRYVNLCPRFVD